MITFLLFCLLYFLPTLVAVRRGHPVAGILVLNLLFGWTVIGWAALLLWSVLRLPRYCYVPGVYSPYPPNAPFAR